MSAPPILSGKLVRDKIPGIIQHNGDVPHTRILASSERLPYLRQKLREETEELLSALGEHSVKEEIADVIEVLHAYARLHNISWSEVENSTKQKRRLRGAFKKFICLLSTESRK